MDKNNTCELVGIISHSDGRDDEEVGFLSKYDFILWAFSRADGWWDEVKSVDIYGVEK